MTQRKKYLRSSLFKRWFWSYALVVLVLFGIFIGWSFASYRREAEALQRREWEQRAASWGTWMDQQLMQAQMLCAAVNASESARVALQTVYVEKQTMNSLQLYNLLGELNRIKGSVRSTSLYNLILAFQGEKKLFLPGNVYSLEGECQALQTSPWFGVNTASRLLGVRGQQMVLNKEYLIYGEDYTGFGSQSSTKGQVLALLDLDQIRSALRGRVDESAAVSILRRDQTAVELGETKGEPLRIQSIADQTVTYLIRIPEQAFSFTISASAWIFLGITFAASMLFLLLIYRISLRYYRPIENIQQMVDRPAGAGQAAEGKKNEFDQIVQGISGLIGERNGYREKMVTITPYARQGMLQAVMRGAGHTETLVEEQFTELKRHYYMVGIVNIAIIRETAAAERRYRDLQELILSVCRDLSAAEGGPLVVAVPENLQNIFVIAASDDKEGFEAFFYRLYDLIEETVGDDNTVITIGAGYRESDLDRLSNACRDAQEALGQMLTGGRQAVYFPEEASESSRGYYFPKDAQKQMIRMIREKDLAGLNGMLDEIYQKNLVETELPTAEVRQMADELYWTIKKALRNAYDLSTTHMRLEPIRDAATIDEIFDYYRQVFAVSLAETGGEADKAEEEQDLEDEVCRYLEAHLYDPDLSLNGIADEFGVSTKLIGLICRKRFGQTFLNYVRGRQIEHAVELLKETDLGLEEIAARCGFTNILTFRRNFKAVTGVNPSEYRE